MTDFTAFVKELQHKLEKLNDTQQSIQTVSLWIQVQFISETYLPHDTRYSFTKRKQRLLCKYGVTK
jgi:hypothetical protein